MRDLDICSLHDSVVVGNDAFRTAMTFIAVAVLPARVHGNHVVGVGTVIALIDAVRARRDPRYPAGHADEQGAERWEGAEDENKPAFR